MRGFKEWFGIIAKGFVMGTADLVPGVSGGTIAFITGIYEELISTIANLGSTTIRDLFKEGIVSTWKKYNLNFLLALFIGIALAVLILSKTIHHLQETHPDQLMSFFFGLVLASTPLIWRSVGEKNKRNLGFGLFGVVAAAILTSLPPAEAIEPLPDYDWLSLWPDPSRRRTKSRKNGELKLIARLKHPPPHRHAALQHLQSN